MERRAASQSELRNRYITFHVSAKTLEREDARTKMANEANQYAAASLEKKFML
jgi:hypothetical protein